MSLFIVPTQKNPRIAVVIPVFKHSVLLADAIESVLNQDSDFSIHIILVNDGCPHAETDETCLDYALTYNEKITYVKKENGGLSSARNYGIALALNSFKTVEAIYLLDADNKIRKSSLRKAMELLDKNNEYDWIYPNIDMFGVKWSGDFGGKYSLLIHSITNICEAGSLVRRRVFEANVLFDTEMKLGFEDWDFFLSAAAKGYRGANLDDFGFLYRKRPESMLADSTRDQEEIKGGMLRKHKSLMSPRKLAQLEQDEAPRYAIYLADLNRYLLTVDPDGCNQLLSPEDFSRLLWSSLTSRGRHHVPSFFVVTTEKNLSLLRSAKILHWSLWRLEDKLEHQHIVTITCKRTIDDRYGIEDSTEGQQCYLKAMLLMTSPKGFLDVLLDKYSTWIDSIVSSQCLPKISNLEITIPDFNAAADDSLRTTACYDFLSQLHYLRQSSYQQAFNYTWDWRDNGITWRPQSYKILREKFSGNPAFPKTLNISKSIGFLLPLVEFGGVEKVALNVARELKACGWSTHLVVLGYDQAAFSTAWRNVFDSISFLCDPTQHSWDGKSTYFGTDIPPWSKDGNHKRAAGMLYWLDAVVNCHGTAAHSLMGQLRRLGVKTIASLHLSDMTRWERPVGHTYLSLAFEHAYDLVTTCSEQLAAWCHGMGIPREKIISIPNAPSYKMTKAEIEDVNSRRQQRPSNQPLRALFLGRLDPQKGIDHLATVIERLHSLDINVEWRIVGRPIVSEGTSTLHPIVDRYLEPPTTTTEELTELYAWADILLLLSDYEGLPLTILEAMRLGVVPVVTDVGANSEVINNGINGILISRSERVEECLEAIIDLNNNPSKLSAISEKASVSMINRGWETATAQLNEFLTKK